MHIPTPSFGYLGIISLLLGNSLAESFHHGNPRHVMPLDNLEYFPTRIARDVSQIVLMSFSLPDAPHQRVTLDLERNDDPFSHSVVVRHLAQDGSERSVDTIPAGSHMAFRGTTMVERRDQQLSNVGWARMSFFVKDGEQLGEGAFSLDGVEYHVQTDYAYRRTRSTGDAELAAESRKPYMVASREAIPDIFSGNELRKRQLANATQCYVSGFDSNPPLLVESDDTKGLEARQRGGLQSLDLGSLVGSTSGCPKTQEIALLGVATDCSYTSQFSTSNELQEHVLATVNTVSRLYEDTFNISIRLQNLTISDETCPDSGASSSTPWNVGCSANTGISDRLGLFSTWVGSQPGSGNALYTLLTACTSGSTVGIAGVGSVCGYSRRRSGPGTNVVVGGSTEWQVLAHEIGHNFGAVHDCTEDCNASSAERCCPFSQSSCDAGGQYLMNPAASTTLTQFSPCTIGNICSAIGRNLVRTSCLDGNEDVPTISTGVCGNGIVEPGEECDCGGADGCGSNNRCCNPTTCSFINDAVCDPSNDGCCTDQCQISGSGNICRASAGLCDIEEVCDGSSSSCPTDNQVPDGEPCGDAANGTACASGQCTSRSMQCGVALFNTSTPLGGVAACNNDTCQMNCSPLGGETSSCQVTGADFLDGTACRGGNLCYDGECQSSRGGGGGGSSGSSVSSWIQDNKTIFIAIVVIGSILVLLAAWCCISCLWRKSSRNRSESDSTARIVALQGAPQMSRSDTAGWYYPGAEARQNQPPPPASVYTGAQARALQNSARIPSLSQRYA